MLSILIALIAFIAFLPALQNDFSHWDDNLYLQDNTAILDVSWYSVQKIFSSFYIGNYQPLTVLTFLAEYRFFKFNPFFYHLDNIILHMIVVLLVFWLFWILSKRVSIAAIVSLLFAIHPLRVESVVWVCGRKDMLYSIFFLGALIAYIKWRARQPAPRLYWLSVLLFLCAILCKAMSMTLPAVLLLVDFFMARKFDKRAVLDKIPYLILAAVFSCVAVVGAYAGGAVRPASLNTSLFEKAATLSYCLVFYLNKLFLPLNLSCLYPLPGNADYAVSMAGILLLGLGAALSSRLSRKIVFGSLFFFITALPILQFVPIGRTLFADRYTYLPCLGVFYLAAEGLVWLWGNKIKASRIKSALFLGAGLAIVVTLSVMTWQRSKVWKDDITLWGDAIKKYPTLAVAYNNRGAEYLLRKNYREALADFASAVAIDPDNYKAYLNLGLMTLRTGNYPKAIRLISIALRQEPYDTDIYDNLVTIYFNLKQLKTALGLALEEVRLWPDYARGHVNLCGVYGEMGESDKALAACRTAMAIDPNYALTYWTTSLVYDQKKEHNLAAQYREKALSLGYKPAGSSEEKNDPDGKTF